MRGSWLEPHKIAWALVAVLAVWALLFDRGDDDDGSSSAQVTLDVAPFSAVEVKGDVDLEIHSGSGEPSVKVQGDDLSRLEARVEGDKLLLDATSASDVKAVLQLEDLRAVTVAGAGKTRLSGVDGKELALVLNGSGKIEAEGKTGKVSAEVNGSGKIDAEQLSCDEASTVINGSGKVELAEPSKLAATIRGSGKVVYGGSPTVTQQISGSGKVVKR